MQARPPIAVGVRLPLAHEQLRPADLLAICRAGLDLGFSSFWAGDRELITQGGRAYTMRGDDDQPVEKHFAKKPIAPAPIEFLWGGFSPVALRLVAVACDGWLPAKQSLESLRSQIAVLKAACDDVQRDFRELRLVAKPGAGPDPKAGRVDRDNLAGYAELGFHEVIVELPLAPDSAGEAVRVLERVAARSWL
jgi:hypothetical protein